ncbi:YheC/YheD family protein [Paenibacillus pabuli]|uniref:YheC/YheD family protein n=1 Tax=Paenibacillus pabuli TaxID=1472 RepID=UPI003CF597CA
MLINRDKWLQYNVLRRGATLAKRLPETQLLQKSSLTKMLQRYQSVVLKPRNGSYLVRSEKRRDSRLLDSGSISRERSET